MKKIKFLFLAVAVLCMVNVFGSTDDPPSQGSGTGGTIAGPADDKPIPMPADIGPQDPGKE